MIIMYRWPSVGWYFLIVIFVVHFSGKIISSPCRTGRQLPLSGLHPAPKTIVADSDSDDDGDDDDDDDIANMC
jgi:hypothetical protein